MSLRLSDFAAVQRATLCAAFTAADAALNATRVFERIEVRRKKLIEMVMNGVAPSEVKDELNANATKCEELKGNPRGR